MAVAKSYTPYLFHHNLSRAYSLRLSNNLMFPKVSNTPFNWELSIFNLYTNCNCKTGQDVLHKPATTTERASADLLNFFYWTLYSVWICANAIHFCSSHVFERYKNSSHRSYEKANKLGFKSSILTTSFFGGHVHQANSIRKRVQNSPQTNKPERKREQGEQYWTASSNYRACPESDKCIPCLPEVHYP